MSDLEKAYDDSGRTVAGIAERLVPVQTGRLKNSIRYRSLTQKAVVQAGRRSFPYAPIVHYGQMPGFKRQPFLTNALAIGYGAVKVEFDSEMDKTIKEVF